MYVLATGTCLPGNAVDNSALAARFGMNAEWIELFVGTRTRYFGVDLESGERTHSIVDLGTHAARQALDRAGLEPSDVDFLVLATATPDTLMPTSATGVADRLGMNLIPAYQLQSGCSGAISALDVARRMLDDDVVPDTAGSICSRKSGYVRFIDVARLNELAEDTDSQVFVTSVPGEFVLRGSVIGTLSRSDAELRSRAARAFDIGDVRTFEQDPTLGLTILAETGQRALSPGINDPGTAIEVLGRIERLLWEEVPNEPQSETDYTPTFARVSLPVVRARTLLDCAVLPISRDGADNPDVTQRIYELLSRISAHPNSAMAKAAADIRDQLGSR